MTTRTVASTGLPMPPDFPFEPYEAIHRMFHARLKDDEREAWGEFCVGWNALSYRFAAMAEHDEAFAGSARAHGLGPPHPERSRQEDALFGFFGAGISAFETFAYGIWAVFWEAGDDRFALATEDQQREVSIRTLSKRLTKSSPNDGLSVALVELLAEGSEFDAWAKVRNQLTHRGVPRRHHSLGHDTETLWGTMRLDQDTTRERRAWLAAALDDMLGAAEAFMGARLG